MQYYPDVTELTNQLNQKNDYLMKLWYELL